MHRRTWPNLQYQLLPATTLDSVVERKDLGSWLEGPSSDAAYWPGKSMGRPAYGPASVARISPRVGALIIDWAIASLFAYLLFDGLQLAILGCFAVLQFLLVGFFGHSAGHRLLRMQVQTLHGKPAGYGRAALRTLLICLVVPPLLVDRDQRGLHDRLSGTILVRI